jgi:hypothetical protein
MSPLDREMAPIARETTPDPGRPVAAGDRLAGRRHRVSV